MSGICKINERGGMVWGRGFSGFGWKSGVDKLHTYTVVHHHLQVDTDMVPGFQSLGWITSVACRSR